MLLYCAQKAGFAVSGPVVPGYFEAGVGEIVHERVISPGDLRKSILDSGELSLVVKAGAYHREWGTTVDDQWVNSFEDLDDLTLPPRYRLVP